MKNVIPLLLCLCLILITVGCHRSIQPAAELSIDSPPVSSISSSDSVEFPFEEKVLSTAESKAEESVFSQAPIPSTESKVKPSASVPVSEFNPVSDPVSVSPPVKESFVCNQTAQWTTEYFYGKADQIRLLRSGEELLSWLDGLTEAAQSDSPPQFYSLSLETGQRDVESTVSESIVQAYADVWADQVMVGAYVSYPGRVQIGSGEIALDGQRLTLTLQATETETTDAAFHAVVLLLLSADTLAGVEEAVIDSQFQAIRRYHSGSFVKSTYVIQRWDVNGVSPYKAGTTPALIRTATEFRTWLGSTYPASIDGCIVYEPFFSQESYAYTAEENPVIDEKKKKHQGVAEHFAPLLEQDGCLVAIPIAHSNRNETTPIVRRIERVEDRLVVHYDSYRIREGTSLSTKEFFFLLCEVDPALAEGATDLEVVRTDYYAPLNQ